MADIKPSFIRALVDGNAGFDIEKLRVSYNRKSTLVLDAIGPNVRPINEWSSTQRLDRMRALAQEYVLFFYLDVNKINETHRAMCREFQELCEQKFLAPLRAFLTQGDQGLQEKFNEIIVSLKKAVDELDYFVDQGEIDTFFKQKELKKIFQIKIEQPTPQLLDLSAEHNLSTLLHERDVDKLLERDQLVQNHFLLQFFLLISFPNLKETKDLSLLDAGELLVDYYEHLDGMQINDLIGHIPFNVRKRYAWNIPTMKKDFPGITTLLQRVLDYQKHRDHALELSESLSFETVRQKSQDWKRLGNLVATWFDGDKKVYERVKRNYWLSLPVTYYPPDWREYLTLRALGFDELSCIEKFSDVNRKRENEDLFYSQDEKYVTARDTFATLRKAVIVFPNKVTAINEGVWPSGTNPFAKMHFLEEKMRERPDTNLLSSINWTAVGQTQEPPVSRPLHPLDLAIINAFAMGYFALAVNSLVLKTTFANDIATAAHRIVDTAQFTSVPLAQKEVILRVMEYVDHINVYAMARFYGTVECRLLNEWLQAPWRVAFQEFIRPLVEAFGEYDKTLEGFSSPNDFVAMPPDQAILDGVYENLSIFEKGVAKAEILPRLPLPTQNISPIVSNPARKSLEDVQRALQRSPSKMKRSRKVKEAANTKGIAPLPTSSPVPIPAPSPLSNKKNKKKKPAASASSTSSPGVQSTPMNPPPGASTASSSSPRGSTSPPPSPLQNVSITSPILTSVQSQVPSLTLPSQPSSPPPNVITNTQTPTSTLIAPSQYQPQFIMNLPPVTPISSSSQGSTSPPPKQNVSVTSSVPTPSRQPSSLPPLPNPSSPPVRISTPRRALSSSSSSQRSKSDSDESSERSDEDSTGSGKTVFILEDRPRKRPRPSSSELSFPMFFTAPAPLPPGASLYAHYADDNDSAQEMMDRMRYHKTPEQRREQELWRVYNDWEALKADPTYAERHETCFPDITARVALERTRIARKNADLKERNELIKNRIQDESEVVREVRRYEEERKEEARKRKELTGPPKKSLGRF